MKYNNLREMIKDCGEKFKNNIAFRRSFITNCAYFAIIALLIFVIVKYAVPLLMPFIL